METYIQIKLRTFFIVTMISVSSVSLLFAQKDSIETREFVYKHASVFRHHGVNLKGYQFDDREINQKLNESIQYQKKAAGKIVTAALMAGAGAILVGSGIIDDSRNDNTGPYNSSNWFYGLEIEYDNAPAYILGGILLGTSIPFFISSAKNKKKMKMSIDETNKLLIR